MQKKIIAIIAFFLTVFGLIYFLVAEKEASKKAENKNNDKMAEGQGVICEYNSDEDAFVQATEKPDLRICDCIKDEEKLNSCREMALNNELYAQAIGRYDVSICKEITVEEIRETCVSATSSAVDFLKKNDPLRLANIYKNSHNEKAIGEFESLISNDSENIENYLSLAMAYAEKSLSEQERNADRNGYLNKALDTISKAESMDSSNSEVYRIYGYILEIKPDLDKSLEMYDKAIALDSANVLAFVGRAHVFNMKGALQKTLDDLNAAADLDKERKEISIYSRLCNIQSTRTDLLTQAKENCKIVIGSESEDIASLSLAYQVLGDIYLSEKRYNESLTYFLKAKSLTPNDASLYVSIAELKISMGRYAESENDIRKAISFNPSKSSPYLTFAKALIYQKKYDEAIEMANRGLTLVDGDVSLLDPNKPAMKKNLYYAISAVYNERGDKSNEKKYEDMGNQAFENN